MSKPLFAIAAAALVILLAGTACQSPPAAADQPAAGQPATITVVTTEFKFQPEVLTVRVGDRVRVTLDNSQGVLQHDMLQSDLKIHAEVQPGKKVTFEFTPAQAGTFDLVCSVPGHKEAGMTGKLVVQP